MLSVIEDGEVCYITRSEPGFDGPWTEIPILRSERRDGRWSVPEIVGSSGETWYLGYREAEVGESVHFAWTPYLDGSGEGTATATGAGAEWRHPGTVPCHRRRS